MARKRDQEREKRSVSKEKSSFPNEHDTPFEGKSGMILTWQGGWEDCSRLKVRILKCLLRGKGVSRKQRLGLEMSSL